jgi:6-phosphogluconolactonase
MTAEINEGAVASLVVASSKSTLPTHLNAAIVQACKDSIALYGSFIIALSGGSLAELMVTLPESFVAANVDPRFDRWHVFLADERCVPTDHADSNMASLRKNSFLSKVSIPPKQIYEINTELISEEEPYDSTNAIAVDYESRLRNLLTAEPFSATSPRLLDLAVLGFGPDGHTCSLFPNHPLLVVNNLPTTTCRSVAPVVDSPKPPPCRITLTLQFLNECTRHVIFCGAGSSKGEVLKHVFAANLIESDSKKQALTETDSHGVRLYQATLVDPPPFPCGMVRPNGNARDAEDETALSRLSWFVDADAMEAAGLLAAL